MRAHLYITFRYVQVIYFDYQWDKSEDYGDSFWLNDHSYEYDVSKTEFSLRDAYKNEDLKESNLSIYSQVYNVFSNCFGRAINISCLVEVNFTSLALSPMSLSARTVCQNYDICSADSGNTSMFNVPLCERYLTYLPLMYQYTIPTHMKGCIFEDCEKANTFPIIYSLSFKEFHMNNILVPSPTKHAIDVDAYPCMDLLNNVEELLPQLLKS